MGLTEKHSYSDLMESDHWQVDLNAWDNAAGALLVQEATAIRSSLWRCLVLSVVWYLVSAEETQDRLKLWKHLLQQVDLSPRSWELWGRRPGDRLQGLAIHFEHAPDLCYQWVDSFRAVTWQKFGGKQSRRPMPFMLMSHIPIISVYNIYIYIYM